VNLAKTGFFSLSGCVLLSVLFLMAGCGSPNVSIPTQEQLAEFENAGPIRPEVDMDRLVTARNIGGLYRLVPGDMLELHIPSILLAVIADPSVTTQKPVPYLCRVSDDGGIEIPMIGRLEAAGRTLSEIEADVINAYYPRYSLSRPSVVARVAEYKTARVSISGAVNKPGVYELRSDQMSLVSLIMEAEGIVDEGAAIIRIDQPQQRKLTGRFNLPTENKSSKKTEVNLSFSQSPSSTVGTLCVRSKDKLLCSELLDITNDIDRRTVIAKLSSKNPEVCCDEIMVRLCELSEVLEPGSANPAVLAAAKEKDLLDILEPEHQSEATDIQSFEDTEHENTPLALPVKGLNMPFADAALVDGASVQIEALNPQVFTVMGLVNKPGAFPYPPNVRYNLLQAIAFGGGVDEVAAPRYVRIYRQNSEGKIVDATFRIKGNVPTAASNVTIKPGDVVAVEHTSRTERRVLLANMFRISTGLGVFYNPASN